MSEPFLIASFIALVIGGVVAAWKFLGQFETKHEADRARAAQSEHATSIAVTVAENTTRAAVSLTTAVTDVKDEMRALRTNINELRSATQVLALQVAKTNGTVLNTVQRIGNNEARLSKLEDRQSSDSAEIAVLKTKRPPRTGKR